MKNKHLVLDLDLTCIHAYDINLLLNLKLNSKSHSNVSNLNKLNHENPEISLSNLLNFKKRINVINIIDALGPKPKQVNGSETGSGDICSMFFIRRPNLDIFLEFCLEYFLSVSIWSAGVYKYVHVIKEYIFPNQKNMIVLTKDDTDFNTDKKGNILSTIKDLKKIYSRIPGSNETNTIILDDTEGTFCKNIKNGILIPEFSPSFDKKSITINDFLKDDDCLLKFMKFLQLNNTKNCEDIRDLNTCCIFTTSLIRYNELLKLEEN